MRLQDLLKLQQPAEDLNDLRAHAVSRRTLAPRSRTDPMLDIAQEAQACFKDQVESVQQRLQREERYRLEQMQDLQAIYFHDLHNLNERNVSALLSKHASGRARQEACQKEKLADLKDVATISNDPILFQLRDINQLNSLETTIREEPRHRPDAIPVQFRILSRKNEKYGVNKESTPLANTPENFYDLLWGRLRMNSCPTTSLLPRFLPKGKTGVLC